MGYTKEQIDRANQINLEQFLRSQGEQLTKSGQEFRWKAHDSVTVKGNKWFRHSQSKGGYPIDFVMEFYGKTFPEAVELLIGEKQTVSSCEEPARPEFRLPPKNENNDIALSYLTETRMICREVAEEFIKEGLLYEDAKYHNVVFVGRDKSGIPRYAHCRGTKDSFKQDVVGSDKSCSFSYFGGAENVLVFESAIDMMSYISLYFPDRWKKGNYVSLGGVSSKALEHFLSEYPNIRQVVICTDRDEAGEMAVETLLRIIPRYIEVRRSRSSRKDWNEDLCHCRSGKSRTYNNTVIREIMEKAPEQEKIEQVQEKKAVPMIRMSDVEQTEVEWLWYPYIPFGKLTIVQGNPGEGKTFFAMQLAAACTNRKFLPDMEEFEPFNMIFQTAEDGLGDTVKPRLVSAEADLDMNRANEVRPIFRKLAEIAQATNCAIVMIGHLNKSAGSQSTYRGLGSIDITAVVRSLLFIGKVKKDPTTRVIVHDKSSLAPAGQSIAFTLGDQQGFRWIGGYDITTEDLLAGGEGEKTEFKQEQAKNLMIELLADGKELPIAELDRLIMEQGISDKTARLARKSMKDKLASERRGKDWWIWLKRQEKIETEKVS